MGKTILVDERAYELLLKQKEILRSNGYGNPSFSDAVKLACGTIKVMLPEVR